MLGLRLFRFHTHPSYSAFWQLVVDSKITLVTDTEVPGCTATADDARDALLPPAKDKNVPQVWYHFYDLSVHFDLYSQPKVDKHRAY